MVVVVPEALSVAGVKLAETPVGRPETENVTVSENPALSVSVIVFVPLLPAVTVVVPEFVSANPAPTVTVTGTLCTKLPLVPVTVTL
jgi:hypothetical protein